MLHGEASAHERTAGIEARQNPGLDAMCGGGDDLLVSACDLDIGTTQYRGSPRYIRN
jgi:hypothetical protein